MVRVGAFDTIQRKVELIRGEIVEMNPAGPLHDDLITYLTNWSVRSCDFAKTIVTSQTGLDLEDQQSRPEPDLMWLKKARYTEAHPRATDVQLAVEVSHSSLMIELGVKGSLYSEAAIVEYWIVDTQARCIHVNRSPASHGYRVREVYNERDTLTSLCCPTAVLSLTELFQF